MKFTQLLTDRRRAIIDDWIERIVATYPKTMGSFLRKGTDQFSNPIGGTVHEGAEAVYDALLAGADETELAMALDTTVRLRAIQAFSPSEAVGYVFELKRAVRKVLASDLKSGAHLSDLQAFDERVDALTLVAFDAYMSCRERLMKIRSSEARNLAKGLLERAGLAFPGSSFEERPEPETSNQEGQSQV